jgi:pimeloyl-ACP methyl ester carboxylesterase
VGGFWRSVPGTVLIVVLIALIVGIGAVGIQVHRVTHPPREVPHALTVTSSLVSIEEVGFRSPDGVDLSGWLLRGQPEHSAVLLAHDAGSSKASLLGLALPLQKAGYNVLLFDFRGHGGSGGDVCTLGLHEKRDVLGAVDFITTLRGVDARGIGVFGIGMGAHAAVLAAADRPAIKVLALDALYPDVSYPLVRRAYAGWGFGVRWLGFLPRWIFDLLNRTTISAERADTVLPRLAGRSFLLIAPASDGELLAATKRLYDAIPESREAERNLITVPASLGSDLSGEEAEKYYKKVVRFFQDRFARP